MRIACDACAAKYSISDDKLTGKAFKIRCKKCSHVILVRAPEPVWHLVIDDDQVGPFTVEAVRARAERGEITRATYGWREGMEAWVALAQIDELAGLFEAAALPIAPAEPPVDVKPEPAADTPRLLAERNESSVLFSMNNLARLASDRPAPVAAAGATAPLQEGSGLIDIRSMASAYRGAGSAAPPTSTIGSIDDLPVFATSSFTEPAVIVPAPARTPPRFVGALIAAIVVLAAIAIVLIVVVIEHDPPPPPRVARIEPVPVFAPVASTAPIAAPMVAVERVTPPVVAPSSAVVVGPHPARGHTAPHVDAPHPPPPPPRTDDCDEVKCVVDADLPCCRARATAKAAPSLPDRLAPKMIAPALEPVKARVLACGATGRIHVHVRVGGDGKVSAATLEPAQDPAVEACVAGAIKRAAFPKTQNGGSFVVPYTF